jgi:hypothetical protein
MPKRKFDDDGNHKDDDQKDDNDEIIIKRNIRPCIRIENCPKVDNLKELIEVGKRGKFYKNINNVMLWDILPYLIELDNMIGMNSLKETIFYQIIYYLQNMHKKNRNEEYLHTIIMGKPGSGKCLAKNTPIIMYDGSVKMVQDIKVGDKLLGDDSTIRNVTSLARGKEKMYKIKQKKADDYIVNESHILSLKLTKMNKKNTYAYINDNKYKKYDIVDISVLDYLNLSNATKSRLKGFKVGVEFEKKEIPFDPYIIGLWLGDGTSAGTGITNQDSTIIKYLYDNLNKNGLYLKHKQNYDYIIKVIKEKNAERHIFSEVGNNVVKNPLMEILKNLNLINNKHIPDIYKINDKQVRLKLLAGLLDSDGSLSRNCYEISQKNKKLADDIVFLGRSLGFYVSISESYKCATNTKEKIKHLYYRLCICGSGLEEIPVLIKRKKANKRRQIKDVLNTGITIEELEIDDYYGFTIDGNHRFLLGDFTVTHNTSVAKILGNIYKNTGILSKDGKFKIGYRDDFVGEYLGQTATKTRKFLNSCLGGVLFIDEVYSLGPGQKDKDSFSKEAIDTICSFLSDHKNDFCCIIAGYEKEIKNCFLSVNSGLERRFPWVHVIDEYSEENLADILIKLLKETKWTLHNDVEKKHLINFFKDNKDFFKNFGGDIETFITKTKMVHSKRVFCLDKEHKFILTLEDLMNGLEMVKKFRIKEKLSYIPLMYT